MDQGLTVESQPDRSYALSGKIMLSAIIILFAVVLFMVCLHLYARWYVHRLHRRRRRATTRAVIYIDNNDPRSVTDRGLEPSVLNSLPVFHYSSSAAEQLSLSAECAVCLSEFGEDEVVRLLPKCGHSFHVNCIAMWFHSHATCPLCRSPVETLLSLAEETVEEGNRSSEPSSSSGTELCATFQQHEGNSNTTSLWGRRKASVGGIIGIRIEGPLALRTESESETPQSQSSPGGTRLLSLKRLFSMTRKTPPGSGRTTPHGAAGSSEGAAELDLEGGLNEPARSQSTR